MPTPTGSVTSSIGGGPVAYWQNGVLVQPGAALTGGVAAAAPQIASTGFPSSGLGGLALQGAAVTGGGSGGVTLAPQIAQNSVVNNAQTYAPDVRAETTNNILKVPSTIPGLPSVSMPNAPGMNPMTPMQFANFMPPAAAQGGMYNSPAVAYSPAAPQVGVPQQPQAQQQQPSGGIPSGQTQHRSFGDMLMHPLTSQKDRDQKANQQQQQQYNQEEIQRHYQQNPQAAPAPAPQHQGGGAPALPNGVSPNAPWDYNQGPPPYPLSQSPFAHPKMAAMAAAMGPRSAALYLGAQGAQQHRNDKMFDAQNAFALERMKQDTELQKAHATEHGKGALTYNQALDEARKIEAMEESPQRIRDLIRLQSAIMSSGLDLNVTDIATTGQTPTQAAATQQKIAEAASAQAKAFKDMNTVATDVARTNKDNQVAMSKGEDYYATREGGLQSTMSKDHQSVMEDQEKSQTFADRVAQAHQQTLQGGLNLGKTQQEQQKLQQDIDSHPLAQAEKAASTAVSFAQAAALASGPLKAQLEQEAQKWRSQSEALMQQTPGRFVPLPTGQSPVQSVDGPLIGRDGKVVMHQNTQRMPISPAVQRYNGQVPPPPNMPAYMAGGISQQGMPMQAAQNVPPPPNMGAPPPAYPGQPMPAQNAPMAPPPAPIALAPAPQPGAMLTDPKVISGYLQAAGGDPNKATEMAQSQGWKIPPAPKTPQAQQQLQQKVNLPAPALAPQAPQGPSWQDKLLEWTRGDSPEQKKTTELMHANAAMRARADMVHEGPPAGPSRAPVTAQNPTPWNDQGILPPPIHQYPGAQALRQAPSQHDYPGGESLEPGRHIRQMADLLGPIPGHIMDGTTGRVLGEIAQSAAHRYGLDKPFTPPLQYYPGAEPVVQHNFPGGQSVKSAREQSVERQLRERASRGDKRAEQLLAQLVARR